MRLFETNENEAVDSPTPRDDEPKMPHCNINNPMMELTLGFGVGKEVITNDISPTQI